VHEACRPSASSDYYFAIPGEALQLTDSELFKLSSTGMAQHYTRIGVMNDCNARNTRTWSC
jgi:hypothetical protein